MIQIGLCTTPDQAEAALAAGFDYVELPIMALADLDRHISNVRTAYLFFPGDVSLYDPNFDALAHAQRVCQAAVENGATLAVIGGGSARRSTPQIPPQEAENRFLDLVDEIQNSIAEPLGLQLAPEALCDKETDVFNSTAPIAQALADRNLPYTFDTYHYLQEPTPQLPTQLPAHIHLASQSRHLPEEDDLQIHNILKTLKEKGYQGRLSFEGNPGSHELSAIADRMRLLAN